MSLLNEPMHDASHLKVLGSKRGGVLLLQKRRVLKKNGIGFRNIRVAEIF